MFKMRVRTNLSAVCVIYSYAISAYNNFDINWEDIYNKLLQKKVGNNIVENLPKNVATIKNRLMSFCEEYGIEYKKDILINPIPKANIYEKLFLYDDFDQIINDKISFAKNFLPYITVLKNLVNGELKELREIEIIKKLKNGREDES